MKKSKIFTAIVAATALLTLTACGNGKSSSKTQDKAKSYKVGVVSDSEKEIWKSVAADLKEKDGIDLEIKEFSDYNTPNAALVDGSIDLNAFQHIAFLDEYNSSHKQDIVSIGFTYVSPLGLYSKKVKDYKDIKDGDEIAIQNDVVNCGRALQLLNAINIITLKSDAPASPTVNDIEKYNVKVKITEVDASQTASSLPDVAAATVNTNYALDAGLKPTKDAIYLDTERLKEVNDIYKNIIAVKPENKDNPDFKKIVEVYQTDKTAELIKKNSDGNDIPAWTK